MQARTLGQLLEQRAESASGRDWDIRLLFAGGDLPQGSVLGPEAALDLDFQRLLQLSRRAATRLHRHGVGPGDRVLLLLPTGVAFLAGFFGCQLLGAVPVPLVPPWTADRQRSHGQRIERIARICQAQVAITEAKFLRMLAASSEGPPPLTFVLGGDLFEEQEPWQASSPVHTDAPAFIQFTSGSTTESRGVVVEQAAALDNCRFITERLRLTSDDIICSWLPLHHDMGLVGHVLGPLFAGLRSILIPPESFVLQPRVWLESISQHRATASTAPNFAYELCVARVSAGDVKRLDLGSWRIAMCGGEPVRPETLERFRTHFEPAGFEGKSFVPVYGLAEATLAVTMPDPGQSYRVDRVSRARLEEAHEAEPVGDAGEPAPFVSVGKPDRLHELRIAGENGATCRERQVGQIEVRGPSVMKRYFADPVATEAALAEGWLCTGDLGYLADGELFVTGRSKELIIKGGRNIYPYDVEAAATLVPGVRAGRCAALGIENKNAGTEDLVLVCETRVTNPERRQALTLAIIASVFTASGVRPDVVHLLAPGSVPRTSSGKIQRALLRARLERGELGAKTSDVR